MVIGLGAAGGGGLSIMTAGPCKRGQNRVDQSGRGERGHPPRRSEAGLTG